MDDNYKVFDFHYCKKTIDMYYTSRYITKKDLKKIVMSWIVYYIDDRKKLVKYIKTLK